MISHAQFSVKFIEQAKLLRTFPGMKASKSNYYRCAR
jgi:hypothetical protein